MTYAEANEKGLDVLDYDWDSLVKQFGEDTLKEIAEHAYGRPVTEDLYHHLWSRGYLDNFTHPWYFKANYYNLYKGEPDMDKVLVNVKSETA